MGVNAGVWSLTITTLACVAGGLGFVMLRRAMGTLATAKARTA